MLKNERIACNQLLYHLRYRGIEHNILHYCSKHEIAVVGYSPFGHGDFPSPQSAAGKLLYKIAIRHGKTPRQVALNFLLCHKNIFTIPKTSHKERIKENSGGVGWSLTKEEMSLIDQAFPLPDPNVPLEMISEII